MTAQAIGTRAGSACVEDRGDAQPAGWGAVYAMALCTAIFALPVRSVV